MTEKAPNIRLGTAVVPTGETLTDTNVSSYRAVSTHEATAENLGPLRDLPGHWQGTGISLIARPDIDPENPDGFFLQLNLLRESIEFTTIGSPVPNRGSRQEDISLYGLTYVQKVTDAVTGGALHIEPGLFLRIPATTAPGSDETIARLGNVPHGNAFCTVGKAEAFVPPPGFKIPTAPTVPFKIGGPQPPHGTPNPFKAYDLNVDCKFRTSPLPPEITQEIVDNPAQYNQAMLDGHTITHMTVLPTSTDEAGGVQNIPFIKHNADAVSLQSVFAIQRMLGPLGTEFVQLQYTQTALLNFREMIFPHVTVATLIKVF
jgi:hypothetical protein